MKSCNDASFSVTCIANSCAADMGMEFGRNSGSRRSVECVVCGVFVFHYGSSSKSLISSIPDFLSMA